MKAGPRGGGVCYCVRNYGCGGRLGKMKARARGGKVSGVWI